MAIPSAMAITSTNNQVAIPSATITLHQLSHMWFPSATAIQVTITSVTKAL